MWLSPLPTLGCHSKCKVTTMALTFWLLFMATVIVQQAQAGVIKKRETTDTRPTLEMTTTTTTAPTISPNHDPDIEESQLTKTTPDTRLAIAPADLQSNDSTPVTKLVLQPVGKLTPMTTGMENSKEYMHNEIALNETRKVLKISNSGDLSEHLHNNNTNETEVHAKKNEVVDVEETEKLVETTTVLPVSPGQADKEFGNDIASNPIQSVKESMTTGDVITQVQLITTTESVQHEENPKTTSNITVNENSIEATDSKNTAALPTTLTVKDNSLETNHISDDSKQQQKQPNEVATERTINADYSVFSISSNNTSSDLHSKEGNLPNHNIQDSLVEKENSTLSSENPANHTLNIQDGLDRDSLKDIGNDLPDKTTEKTLDVSVTLEPLDINKLDYGRSMFKPEPKEEESLTLTLTNYENSTDSPAHIANNIDLPDNNGKKAKFINDNSTNAQQMNLPGNAEVWSLAGLKSLPATFNVTMETAPKHKANDDEGVQQIESPVNNTHINRGQSEKFLLDWSHIMMDKELAAATTISSYQEISNNEVIANNEKEETMAQTTTPRVEEKEEETTNLPMPVLTPGTSTLAAPITANSTILSVTSSGDDNVVVGGDKQEAVTTAAGFVDAFNSFEETTTLATEIKPTTVASTPPSSSPAPPSETVASPTSHTNLNEINLTLNKTAEFTEQENDEQNNGSVDKVNVTERAPETAVATAVVSKTTTTTPSAVEQISSEPTTAFSSFESSNVNVSAVNEIFEKSQKYTENNENNNSNNNVDAANKEIIELPATATTTEPAITTYKPTFRDISSADSTPTTIPPAPLPTSTTAANTIPIAEVVDQNGNEIEQQKQSINVETTTAAESVAGSFNNISSTIKTHLNEQVLLETTTTPAAATTITTNNILTTATTTNGTSSEKTTSSSTDDDNEIINKGKEEEFQLETITTQTTPKDKDHTGSGQQSSTERGEEEEQVRNTSVTAIVIGSSTTATPPPPLSEPFEKERQEIETTTTTTAASTPNETPVVVINITQGGETNNLNESFASTTPEPLTTTTVVASTTALAEKEKDEEDKYVETTTTKVVDTYFKFPVKVTKKEQQPNEEISTTTSKEYDDKDLETSTMSTPSSTTTEAATTAKEETYISLLDDLTTTTITSTTTTTTSEPTQPPPPPPPPTPTTTTAGIEITSKIEEIYKVIVSTTTETTPTTSATTPRLTSEEVQEDANKILSTTSRILFNASETTMIPVTTPTTTSPAPTIIATADISGKSLPPLNTIMAGGNSGNMYPKNSDASGETDVNVIIAITVSVIGVIALILLVAFLYLMRKRQKQTSYSQRCRPVSLDEYAIDNGSVGGSMRKGSALRSSKRTYGNFAFDDPSLRHNAMGVHELAKFSVEKLRIFEEFRDVPQITAREDEVPTGCEDKNRYANVLPLPETRVVLQCLNNDDKTEYINANYVTGPKDAPNYYIACQAPLDTTVEDFWRMIWEQQSRVIIQATDLIENGVEKCADYLPPSVTLDNHSTFGDFQVTLQNREVKDKYAISTVLLKHTAEHNATRELTHYWYKWPETGVPVEEAPIIAMLLEARSSLISYAIEQANEDKENSSTATLKSAEEGTAGNTINGASSANKDGNVSGGNGEINGNISMVPLKKTARNQGPLTIHCSPGTGRTGTIIACDIAIRSLETPKRTVDIPQIVYHVRRGRASAVVTKEQYEFIYKVANMYAAKITNPTNYN